MASRRSNGRIAAWALCLPLLIMAAVHASEELAPSVRIANAETQLDENVYTLNADLIYALGPDPLEALANGVPIVFELQIEVLQPRRLLPDSTVATLRQRDRLKYLSLTRRYLVSNLNSGERSSFRSQEEALAFLGRVRDLPILDRGLLEAEDGYQVRMRVVLDIESLPAPLRLLAYLSSQWRINSKWTQWSL
jgi:hypothetical protein